jgi:hypothetical protein
MKLTAAERNHLLHLLYENCHLTKGPALSWNGENGFFHHEVLPMIYVLSEEMKTGGTECVPGELPSTEWAPPGTVEEFRKRLEEAKQWKAEHET